jgi:hypothetical protein
MLQLTAAAVMVPAGAITYACCNCQCYVCRVLRLFNVCPALVLVQDGCCHNGMHASTMPRLLANAVIKITAKLFSFFHHK